MTTTDPAASARAPITPRRGAPAVPVRGCEGEPGSAQAPVSAEPGIQSSASPAPQLPGGADFKTPASPGTLLEGAGFLAGSTPGTADVPGGRARARTSGTWPGRGGDGQPRPGQGEAKAFLDAHLAGKMTEAELEEEIRDACKKLGIIRFHVRFSLGTTPGLPDDILIGPRGILWRECKTRKGKLTAAQVSAGEALRAAGQDWDVWRPEDWFSGRIAQELAALARPGAA